MVTYSSNSLFYCSHYHGDSIIVDTREPDDGPRLVTHVLWITFACIIVDVFNRKNLWM